MSRCISRYASALALTLTVAPFASAANPTDFTLQSGDRKFNLADAHGKFVALHFLLLTDCPYCLKYVADYVDKADTVPGVVHIFIKPDSHDAIDAWKRKLPPAVAASTPIYRDPDSKLAADFNVADGYKFHGQTMHYPALILLGPDGAEVFRYQSKSNTDRLAFDAFARKVAELQKDQDLAEYNLPTEKVALKGFDPVSYFSGSSPQQGRPDLTASYRGVTYRFASPANRHRFAESPDKFLPTYGGWCATAMADGRKVDIDPQNYKLTNGRLFLFYKGWLGNARNDWLKDEPGMTRKADAAWTRLAPHDARAERGKS